MLCHACACTGVARPDPARKGSHVKINGKRILQWTIAIFVLYAVYESPEQAGAIAGQVADAIGTAISSVLAFFDQILRS